MALDSLAPGQSARVTAVAGEGELRRHLLDMGLIPGVVVTLQKVAPMGDPLQVRLRGHELTLRASEAAKVETGPVLSDEELASTAPSRPRPPREARAPAIPVLASSLAPRKRASIPSATPALRMRSSRLPS